MDALKRDKNNIALVEADQWGPYRKVSRLGQGGMGEVFLVEHVGTGARAALKTLSVQNAPRLKQFRHEIETLKRLHHPGVVAHLDDGFVGGAPWLAMGLVEGRPLTQSLSVQASVPDDVSTHFTAWGTAVESVFETDAPIVGPSGRGGAGRLGFDATCVKALSLCAQVARTLAHIHGEGLLHGDIKPSNVVVTPDDRAVLVDFGLATECGGRTPSTSLHSAGRLMGSAPYMSPERISGGHFDIRHDLYAFGCMLFEVVARWSYFARADPKASFEAQKWDIPPQLVDVVEGVPATLSDLTASLLAKSPSNRPGNARKIVAVLDEICGTPEHPYPLGHPHLHPPEIFGRDGAKATLEQALSGVSKGEGSAVFVLGETGLGKTSLAMETVVWARRENLSVFIGQGRQSGGAVGMDGLSVFRGVLEALCDKACVDGDEVAARWFGKWGGVLLSYAPFLRRLPGHRHWPEPTPLSPEASELRAVVALMETLDTALGEQASLLVLDDLQWADPLSILALERLAVKVTSRPWGVLGLMQSEKAPPSLLALVRSSGFASVSLERLDSGAIEAITAQMLAQPAPEALMGFVQTHSVGNPFLAGECLRWAMLADYLSMDAGGQWHFDASKAGALESVEAPKTVTALFDLRLVLLSDKERTVSEAMAIFPDGVRPSVLEAVSGLASGVFSETVAGFLRKSVFIWRGMPGEHLCFVHGHFQRRAVSDLDEARLRTLHIRAAEALLKAPSFDGAELGLHWEAGGRPLLARSAYLDAGHLAIERNDIRRAGEMYRAVLRLFPDDDPDRSEVATIYAESVLLPQHKPREALKVLGIDPENDAEVGSDHRLNLLIGTCLVLMAKEQRALLYLTSSLAGHRAAGDASRIGRALEMMGLAHRKMGALDRAAELYVEALEVLREAGDVLGEGQVLNRSFDLFKARTMLTEARETALRLLECHQQSGDLGLGVNANHALVRLDMTAGNYPQAEVWSKQALTLSKKAGNLFDEASAYNRLSLIKNAQGSFEEALEHIERTLSIAKDMRFSRLLGMGLNNRAIIHQDTGDLDKALEGYREAVALHHELGNKASEGLTLGNIANTLIEMGRFEEGLEEAHRSLEIHRALDNTNHEGRVLSHMATALGALGRFEEALEHSRESIRIHRELGFSHHVVMDLEAHAEVLLWSGNVEEARRTYEEALSMCGHMDFQYQEMMFHCGLGLIAVMEGRDPKGHLKEAQRLFELLKLLPNSRAGVELERLVSAIAKSAE